MPRERLARRKPDPARKLAFHVLRAISSDGAYANLELNQALAHHDLSERDAAFVTELVFGTCRLQGTYDAVIAAASGRDIATMQPALLDVLRLGAHQILSMRVPDRAAVSATVELAGAEVSEKVVGLTNAVLRKVGARTLDEWITELRPADELGTLALRTHHPRWIAAEYEALLGDEAEDALAANNVSPVPTLVVRPGLATVGDLQGEPCTWSPYGVRRPGNPANVPAVAAGRAGVQDEGSQLVAMELANTPAPQGPWLDLCAGPGGKAALLAGLAAEQGEHLVANEAAPHRAKLVSQALRAYPKDSYSVVCSDGTKPSWQARTFAKVLADVPCTGLGALRRRPESRWRRTEDDLAELIGLQRQLLVSALDSCMDGGVVAYVTCSPHHAETVDIVHETLASYGRKVSIIPAGNAVPGAQRDGDFMQLWPHRHETDAMFLALLRVGVEEQTR